ncbi:MAG TPA: HisA/HisF-related TIM barrel protein [Urbifossiella sp.]|jgi:phosphoribosylformimino-5-aminoimidazole carboxamide ribotide isomerase|nr:HisA/HisF-related TIM barrel protein [Urbifossiella sp.]
MSGRAPIIPVLDLMGGRVVRAVGGRRSEYRPVRSVLTDSTDPVEVAKAMVAATGAGHIYLADLDGIIHGRPDPNIPFEIEAAEIPVIYDAGHRNRRDLLAGIRSGVWGSVVASETAEPTILDGQPLDQVVFSIDLFDGRILGDWQGWGVSGPDAVVDLAGVVCQRKVKTLILLDLARVGTGTGPGTERFVAECKAAYPDLYVMAGGGVKTWADAERLADAGADEILVASAVHDGTLTLPRPRS